MFCLYSHLSPMCMQCLQGPEEGIIYPGNWSSHGCEPWLRCQEFNLAPLQEQSVLLNPEPSLQCLPFLSLFLYSFSVPFCYLLLNSLLFLTQLPPGGRKQGCGWEWCRAGRTPSQASGLLTRRSTTYRAAGPAFHLSISFSSPEISPFK